MIHYPKRITVLFVLLTIALLTRPVALDARQTRSPLPSHPEDRLILQQWLAQKKEWRVATEEDCGDCQDDLAQMRKGYGGMWKPNPRYQPYYVRGDFNSDGVEDFAVALIHPHKWTRRFAVAIFNGPFAAHQGPAFYQEDFDLTGGGLFFGPPRPKPYRLIAGRFESDNGWLFAPKGKTYVAE